MFKIINICAYYLNEVKKTKHEKYFLQLRHVKEDATDTKTNTYCNLSQCQLALK